MDVDVEGKRPRGIRTKKKLVAVAIDALVEDGYVRATTTNIVARAGVSQGALFKHFSSKNELLAAALAELFTSLRQEFRERLNTKSGPDRVAVGLEVLWALCHSPKLTAAFELYLAARTDEDLSARIHPVMLAHRAASVEQAIAVFPPQIQAHPGLPALVAAMINMVQGAALVSSVLPNSTAAPQGLDVMERFVRGELSRLLEDLDAV
ncbi:MAG: TetR/AcrR family transcriptional regulator [Myxococcota bacterium]